MNPIRKSLALILILIIAISSLSLIIVKPANAQTIPKPSVPEFTVNLADHSYDVPPKTTSTTNSYTNKTTIITHPGYHVKNVTIDVTITNQPFQNTVDGNATNLYYAIQTKAHFANWTYDSPDIYNLQVQSNSSYTVISFPTYQAGYQVDFRVAAVLGFYFDALVTYTGGIPFPDTLFIDKTSDWSRTQTFTMPSTTTTITPNPTAPASFSSASQLQIIAASAIVALLVTVIALLLYRRHRRTNHELH